MNRGCPRNCNRRVFPSMPLDSIREGGASMLIREPGDLPDAVVLSCGRGVPNDRGFPSSRDGVGVCAGTHSQIKAAHGPVWVVHKGYFHTYFQISVDYSTTNSDVTHTGKK